MWLLLLFVVFVIGCACDTVVVCPGQTASLSCAEFTYLTIESAFYGDSADCTNVVACNQTVDARAQVKAQCSEQQSSCVLSNSLDGGFPCASSLHVSYGCRQSDQMTTNPFIVCHGQRETLSCKTGIKINEASYVRSDGKICPSSVEPSSNSGYNVTVDFQQLCDGKQTCVIEANNTGSPGLYLQVNYNSIECIDTPESPSIWQPAKTIHNMIVCQGGNGQLSCSGSGDVIKVVHAAWGRWRPFAEVCPDAPASVRQNEACGGVVVSHMVAASCDGTTECTLVGDNRFGNPCPGTEKYLTVSYVCAAFGESVPSVICPGDTWRANCNSDVDNVVVHRAYFGRWDDHTCPSTNTNGLCIPVDISGTFSKCKGASKECVVTIDRSQATAYSNNPQANCAADDGMYAVVEWNNELVPLAVPSPSPSPSPEPAPSPSTNHTSSSGSPSPSTVSPPPSSPVGSNASSSPSFSSPPATAPSGEAPQCPIEATTVDLIERGQFVESLEAPECTVHRDVIYPHVERDDDVEPFELVEVADVSECCDKCHDHDNCKAWNFGYLCVRKSTQTGLFAFPNGMAGTRQCEVVQDGYAFLAWNNIDDLYVESPERCCAECVALSNCQAWTVVGRCELFSYETGTEDAIGRVSGVDKPEFFGLTDDWRFITSVAGMGFVTLLAMAFGYPIIRHGFKGNKMKSASATWQFSLFVSIVCFLTSFFIMLFSMLCEGYGMETCDGPDCDAICSRLECTQSDCCIDFYAGFAHGRCAGEGQEFLMLLAPCIISLMAGGLSAHVLHQAK